MTRPVVVDLDDAGSLDRLWSEIERAHAAERVAPSLRVTVGRAIDVAEKAGRLTANEADDARHALEREHPKSVLAGWPEIIPDRPSLGAFQPRQLVTAPPPVEVVRRSTWHMINQRAVPLRAGLAALAEWLVSAGCEREDVETAFAAALRAEAKP